MRRVWQTTVGGMVFAMALSGLIAPAGAIAGDGSNPVSTGCSKNGLVEYPVTARTYGPWEVKLRRSSGCGTIWAYVTRLDGLACKTGGTNCVRARVTRTRSDGVKTATQWRKQVVGTRAAFSFQLIGLNGSSTTADISTFSGRNLGTAGTIRVSASGVWSAS